MAVLPGDPLPAGAWRYGFLARKASGNGMMNHFFLRRAARLPSQWCI
jgi:hypothetical protein